jgi:hypothetical protein
MNTPTARRLSPDQIEAYHADGFLHLPGVFSAEETKAWHAEADRLQASDLVHADNLRTRWRNLPDGSTVLEKFDPVTDVSPVFRSVAEDERIQVPLTDLFGEAPSLFKDKLIFKPAGATGYGAHQDHIWWQPFPAEKLVSVMVAVDGANAENGAIEMVAGRHQKLLVPVGEMRGFNAEEQAPLADLWQLIETRPGDILIFHCLTPHRSGTNTSQVSRRQFYPSYIARSYGDLYDAHYEHYKWYVERGLGDEAKGRLYYK